MIVDVGQLDTARSKIKRHWPIALLSVGLFVVYGAYAVSRQATYLTAGYDLGIFDQAVRNYAHFRAPIVPLKGADYNIFADHFHPIIATAAPLYWIWDSPVVLLLLQAALIAASVPFVHAFAARRVGPRAALIVAAVYGVGWPIQAMIDFDFHEIAFAVPLLAAAIDALDRREDRTLLIAAGLLLLVREDMGAVLVVIGLLRVVQRQPRRTGWFLIASGIATYLLVTAVVIPAFAPSGKFSYWTFDALGSDLPDALVNIVIHPIRAVRLFFTPSIKSQTLGYLFVPLALLPLRSRYVWVAAPLLAERFFNSREALWTTHYHYSALPWLILALAMVDGAQRMRVWSRPALKSVLLCYLMLVPGYLTAIHNVTPQVFRRLVDGKAWQQTAHLAAQKAAVHQIPKDVCVSVDDRLAPQLTNRDRVTLPGISTPRTDYIVLDMSQAEVGYPLGAPATVLDQADASGFQTVFKQESMIVLKSPEYRGPTRQCRPQ